MKASNFPQDNEPATGIENPSEVVSSKCGLHDVLKTTMIGRYLTINDALACSPSDADTLVMLFFPCLSEHISILTSLSKHPLRNIVFRRASRTRGFFLPGDAHALLDMYEAVGLHAHWHDTSTDQILLYAYKKGHGFFVHEDLVRQLRAANLVAFYGSAASLETTEILRISALVDRLTTFIGPTFGVLTGGGPGVMRLATDLARDCHSLTGACFLELEAQPPERGVDFFNTFQGTARHNRQKWFQASDFCVFSVGGIGTMEEIGIELCNLKLGIRPRVPYVFYNAGFWRPLKDQLQEMIALKRAPSWMLDYLLFTNDPDEVVAFYKQTLNASELSR